MKHYRAQDTVDEGFYWNPRRLAFKSLEERGPLPGETGDTYLRVPALLVLPMGLAVHPGGAYVYVGSQFGGGVSVIDTATNTVVDTISAGTDLIDIITAQLPPGVTLSQPDAGDPNSNYPGSEHPGQQWCGATCR